MACFDVRSVNICVVIAALAGCTTNPWFYVESDGGMSDSSGDATSGGGTASGPTSEPATSAPPTSGDATGETTQIGGESTTGEETATLTTGGPGSDPGTTTDPDPDSGPDDTGPMDSGDEVCGNGVVDPGEDCDLGADNSDDGACLLGCTAATCGDGKLQAGVEECDDGDADSTDECTSVCKPATCGDGFILAGEEECDEGVNNSSLGECSEMCLATFCGDAIQQDDEACDQGAQNGTGLGKCSPDCLAIVQTKLKIMVSGASLQGDLAYMGSSGLAGADKLCAVFGGYKAMIVDGGSRVASTEPWQGKVPGWVLKPFTAYVDGIGAPIGVTGAEALLGAHAMPKGQLAGPILLNGGHVWTGMNDDWTASDSNCEGWTSKQEQDKGAVGDSKDAKDQYLRVDGQEAVCNESRRIYCAQQPG